MGRYLRFVTLGVLAFGLLVCTSRCGDHDGDGWQPVEGGGVAPPVTPSCEVATGGRAEVSEPELIMTLDTSWREGWLASPAIVDLDGDGTNEIVVPRGERVYAFNADGTNRWLVEDLPGRVWASPIVADFSGDTSLEIVFASREAVYMLDASGGIVPGFPVTWEDELRSIAAGDVNGDGQLDIVVATTRHSGVEDVVHVFGASGSKMPGFPPFESGSTGCEVDDRCYPAGAFDQNIAVGDLDGDGRHDIVVPMDNAYNGVYRGTGEVFDTYQEFPSVKVLGVRHLHDLALSYQGWPDDEGSDLQAHFTNTPPAIADLDQDGSYEIILLASVQNGAQSDRKQGVALWAEKHDASRLAGFEEPVHFPDYMSGLWDAEGTNIPGMTNQATVADLNAERPGLEVIFGGFDGRIHAVDAKGEPIWQRTYTTDSSVWTGGVLVVDLSGDGIPEIIFNTYSTGENEGALFILDAGGNLLHEMPLPGRGALPVPSVGDLDGDEQLEIVVSLKDTGENNGGVLVYSVPGSSVNCLLWPTGRANLYRNGWVRSE